MSLFVARWETQEMSSLRRLLLLEDCTSVFGRTDDGLCDFRGLAIEESLHRISLAEIDFSESSMNAGQLSATVERCDFSKCRYESSIGNEFIDCVFHKSTLARSVLFGKFLRCTFSSTNLVGVRGSGVTFEDCTFEDANLRKASFYDSTFRNCRILNCKFGSGSLAGTRFNHCQFENADFSKTVMERVVGVTV